MFHRGQKQSPARVAGADFFERKWLLDEQDSRVLAPSRELQRKAQWRLDLVAVENSMGFHAPREMARILGESIDSRQAQLAAGELAGVVKPAAADAVAK